MLIFCRPFVLVVVSLENNMVLCSDPCSPLCSQHGCGNVVFAGVGRNHLLAWQDATCRQTNIMIFFIHVLFFYWELWVCHTLQLCDLSNTHWCIPVIMFNYCFITTCKYCLSIYASVFSRHVLTTCCHVWLLLNLIKPICFIRHVLSLKLTE